MSINVGKTDQVLRAVAGLILLLTPFATNLPVFGNTYVAYGAALVGAVLLLTSMFRICPIYRVLGINSCKA